MEPTKEHNLYGFAFTQDINYELPPRCIHKELVHVYGNDAPSLSFQNQNQHFAAGKETVNHYRCSGIPRTSLTASLVQRAEALKEHPTITPNFIFELGVSYGSAYSIVHQHLVET